MKLFAIIAEYNPFHNGHKYHIDRTVASGATHIVAVMSGDFVQRGDFAVLDKRTRVLCALNNGADLVVELPIPWALATAERFSYGAVYLADALGCVDSLSFGAEEKDVNMLIKAADALSGERIDASVKRYLERGCSYASAREAAFIDCSGLPASLIAKPNNILAVEYITALKKLGSQVKPYAVERNGAQHDSAAAKGNIAGASYLRQQILSNDTAFIPSAIRQYVPVNTVEIIKEKIASGSAPASAMLCERAILADMRKKTAADFRDFSDVSEGLENRLVSAAASARSLEELYALVKTKRYSHSRIRRAVLSSYIGIPSSFASASPPYIRVLGFNEKGREILHEISLSSKIPVITKSSDIKTLPDFAKRVFELECRSCDLFNLALPEVGVCATDMTDKIVIVER